MKMSEILDLPMQENDASASTIREYLKVLLVDVIVLEESFSGKRPFGNSGWKHELYKALVTGNVFPGVTLDQEDGFVRSDFDSDAADRIIIEAIESL